MTGTFVLTLALAATAQAPVESAPTPTFEALSTEFVAFHLYFNPVLASSLGASGYDDRLPDVSRAGLQARADAYQAWLDRLAGIDQAALTGDAVVDYVVLERGVRAQLLELTEIKSWERDPAYYVDLMDRAIVPLVRRQGSARERMNALTSRLRQSTTLLAEARSNLAGPPALFTERAEEGARGLADMLRSEAATAFDTLAPGPGKDDYARSVARAAGALDEYALFLREDLLPRSDGQLALGPERMGRLLLNREHVLVGPDQVLAMLEAEVQETRARLEGAARRLDPSRRPAEVVADVTTRTLAATESARSAEQTMGAARRFIFRSLFLTVPSDRVPRVSVRHPRSPWEGSVVSTVGALATQDGSGELTLLSPAGQPDRGPGVGVAGAVVLEEAFPGRFVEDMYARRSPTRLRKVLRGSSTTGAWALYSSAALVADGLPEGPEALEVAHLARYARVVAEARAALLLHVANQDPSYVSEGLARDALLTPAQARDSWQRAAHMPLARGVLGALSLAQLREDFMRPVETAGQGTPSIRRFHDAFLAAGLPPTLARQVLLLDGPEPGMP